MGLVGRWLARRREYGASRSRGVFGGGRIGRAGRRAPHAERAVIAHSSPEPAASLFGGGACGERRVGVLRTQREL